MVNLYQLHEVDIMDIVSPFKEIERPIQSVLDHKMAKGWKQGLSFEVGFDS